MGETKISAKSIKWFLEASFPEIEWEFEVFFHPTRRWQFDLSNKEHKIAIEIEGGIFIGGAHGSISGILRDVEKYNEATALGWRIIRAVPTKITLTEIETLVKKIIEL